MRTREDNLREEKIRGEKIISEETMPESRGYDTKRDEKGIQISIGRGV